MSWGGFFGHKSQHRSFAIDTRLTLAALRSAIANREPSPGCVHYSDRGAQYAADQYREMLAEHGLRGSMGRRGVPYDNAKTESFMKTSTPRRSKPRNNAIITVSGAPEAAILQISL